MAVRLELKVCPQSGKQGFSRDKSGMIKCQLKSPPEGGKANEELIKLIGKILRIPQENIIILQGITARKKLIKIETNETLDQIIQKLGIQTQTTI